LEAPVGVGQLDEEEVLRRRIGRSGRVALGQGRPRQGRAENNAEPTQACEGDEFAPVEIVGHNGGAPWLVDAPMRLGPGPKNSRAASKKNSAISGIYLPAARSFGRCHATVTSRAREGGCHRRRRPDALPAGGVAASRR